jgi:hypothetical protein
MKRGERDVKGENWEEDLFKHYKVKSREVSGASLFARLVPGRHGFNSFGKRMNLFGFFI